MDLRGLARVARAAVKVKRRRSKDIGHLREMVVVATMLFVVFSILVGVAIVNTRDLATLIIFLPFLGVWLCCLGVWVYYNRFWR
jgi:hypothetical protein